MLKWWRRPSVPRVILRLEEEQLAELRKLNEKVGTMVQELQNLDQAIAKIEADAINIANNVQATRDEVVALREEVAALQAQIDAGSPVTPAQLQALADRATAVDAALDAIVPDQPPPA